MTNSNHLQGDPRTEALSNVPAEERAMLGEVWDLVADAEEAPQFKEQSIEDTWQRLSAFARSSSGIKAPVRPPLRLLTSRRTWMAAAATFLLCALGISWWLRPVTVQVPAGRQLAVNLPDGSVIQLNSGSSLLYPRRFGNSREVHLEGEGFFEVAPSSIPFVLSTFNARIEVMGTKFNVKAWERSAVPATSVTLTEGRVLFSDDGTEFPGVVMQPGETRRLALNAHEISPPDTVIQSTAVAWKEGNMAYRDEPLAVILEDIERRFAIDIDLRATHLLQKEFTFEYRQPKTAKEVVNILSEGLGLRYSQTARGIAVYPPEP